VLAHRGLHTGHPENTLSAFQAALSAGATHIETDAHVSADGVAVLVHDPVIVVDGASIVISECTARELASLDVGGGESVPSLSAALARFPHARFNIDVKVSGAAAPVVRAIERHKAHDRVLIASFTAACRLAAVRRMPGVATSASAVVSLVSVLSATVGLTCLGRLFLARVDAVQLPTSMLGLRVFTPRFIAMCHAADVEVHAWTINEPDEMRRLLALGVDGLVTDRCDLAGPIRLKNARPGFV
jgi:glycerophosphoryl diester phosphodiesterase